MSFCLCESAPFEPGKFPDEWFEPQTTLAVEVINYGQSLGIFNSCPACDEEHHLCNFIIGTYVQAGFDARCGNISKLHADTTILKVCREHNFVQIQVDHPLKSS